MCIQGRVCKKTFAVISSDLLNIMSYFLLFKNYKKNVIK